MSSVRKKMKFVVLGILFVCSYITSGFFAPPAVAAPPECPGVLSTYIPGISSLPTTCQRDGVSYTLKDGTTIYQADNADRYIRYTCPPVLPGSPQTCVREADADPAKAKADIKSAAEDCYFTRDGILTCISYGFLKFFAWVLGLAGLLLNEVVKYTVLNAGSTLRIAGLDQLWATVRDLTNIVLIFSLLLIGVSTILRIEPYGAKKMLAGVILAALLINFSFAFTRVVIDASNYISYQFYTQLLNSGKTDAAFDSTVGLSGRFMQALSLGTLYSVGKGQTTEPTVLQKNSFLAHMLGIILFIIVAYSFFIAAIHFVGRFVVFIVLMILSPLAVLAFFLPFYKSFWTQWWSNLWSNAIMAPAYFLIVYFSLRAIEGLRLVGVTTGENGYSSLATGAAPGATSIGLLVNFAIIIGLALLSLTVARKIGSEGVNVINLSTRTIGKYGGGLLARNSLRWANVNRLDEAIGKNRWIGGTGLGSFARKYTTGALTNVKWDGKSAKEASKEIKTEKTERKGIWREAGFHDDVENAIKVTGDPTATADQKREAEAKGLRALGAMSDTQLASLGVKTLSKDWVAKILTASQYTSIMDAKNDKFTDEMRDKVTGTRHKDIIENVTRAVAVYSTGKLSTEDEALLKKLDKVSDKELELMVAEKGLTSELKTLARTLTQDKFDGLMKSDRVAASVKAELGKQRGDFLESSLGLRTSDEFAAQIKQLKLGNKGMAGLVAGLHPDKTELIPEIIPHLRPEIAREMMNAGSGADVGDSIITEINLRGGTGSADPAVKAFAKWAQTPGGRYFSSIDAI